MTLLESTQNNCLHKNLLGNEQWRAVDSIKHGEKRLEVTFFNKKRGIIAYSNNKILQLKHFIRHLKASSVDSFQSCCVVCTDTTITGGTVTIHQGTISCLTQFLKSKQISRKQFRSNCFTQHCLVLREFSMVKTD